MIHASIPSPSEGVIHLGPFPLRAYAGCILLGAFVAIVIGERRWVARGGRKGFIGDMAATAVPFGLVGARLYHVITSPSLYVHHPIDALYVWHGGLGIWGGIAAGALGAWLVCRKQGVSFIDLADCLAPALPVAQAIGRFGNYFNQELYGRRTTLPWGLQIDADHAPGGIAGTFQPTFLYEVIWDLGVALLVWWASKRFDLSRGRAFALYVAAYCVGRGWIEALRIDDANKLFGIRLNDYVASIVFLLAVGWIVSHRSAPEAKAPSPETADVPSTS